MRKSHELTRNSTNKSDHSSSKRQPTCKILYVSHSPFLCDYAELRGYKFTRSVIDTQEFARRFNEEEAVWRRLTEKRLLADLSLEELFDDIHRREIERDFRQTRCIEKPLNGTAEAN